MTDADRLGVDEAAVLAAVRSGDAARFASLTERHRRELQVHCYRMLANYEDAQDLTQETFLRAWNKRESFKGHAALRTWLYRIATNACLDFLDKRNDRTPVPSELADPASELLYLQPYPDRMLPEDPQESVVARETIELAFIVAVQHLPPRQRAVLILRDVLGWPASTAADALDLTLASVTSALQRARVTMREQLPDRRLDWRSPATHELSDDERAVVRSYIDAHERNDLDGLTSLLRKDLRFAMLPELGPVLTTAAGRGGRLGLRRALPARPRRLARSSPRRSTACRPPCCTSAPPTTRSTGCSPSRSCTSSTGRSPNSPGSTPPTHHGWTCPRRCDHLLVSYRVSSTPPGNVRVSTRFRFTQLSRVVKNGVPPPTRTGWVTIAYSSISPDRMAAPASVAPQMSMGPPSSALSRVISATASPVTRRAFPSTSSIVEENTTFGMSRQRRANSITAGVASGCSSAVGQWELIASHSLRPYSARPVASTRSDHHWNSSSLGDESGPSPRTPAEVVAGRGDVAVQCHVHAEDQFPHRASLPWVDLTRTDGRGAET